MKILYVSRERTDAEGAVAALRTAAQNVTVLWTSRLEHLAKWIDQNQDLVALIVDTLVDRTGWRSVLEHLRRLAAPPTLLVITPVGAGPDFELLGADEFLIKNESLGRELAVAVRRAVDRARERQSREAVNALEQELARARAALQESEERHRAATAEAAEELARQQARHEIGLARAAATWDMVDEQLREAAIEVERSRREHASASARVERLLRRESELSTRLAEASSTRVGLEQRVAETAAALDAANARAADELRAAAEAFAEHRRNFEARITLEIATRNDLESAVARAVSERESAEQRHAVAIADSAGKVRDLEAALHLAQKDLESQAANIDRLTEREAELTSLLADATTSRRDVERRLAATEAAFQEADTRATRDRLATARRAAEREATLDGQIQEERATRAGLEQSLAEANAALREGTQQRDVASEAFALERAERQAAFDRELAESAAVRDSLAQQLAAANETRDALQRTLHETRTATLEAARSFNDQIDGLREQIEALRASARQQSSQFETRLADERQSYEIRLTETAESNGQLTRERDAVQQSLHAREEQLRRLDVEHRESHERFEQARTAALADIERLTAECSEGRRTLESARHDFQQTLARVAGEHDAVLAARDREIDQLRAEITAATQRSEWLFDGAQLATFRCSRDGTVTKANRAWSALVRRTMDDMRDADGVAAVFESPNDLSWLIDRSLSTSAKESIETTLRRKDGARLFVRLSARAWGSNVIEIVAEDFTRARVLQDRLAQAARMEAVGRLASEVALTCGTLLVGARENAQQWLMDGGGTPASRQHGQSLFDDLTRAGNYLQQLVAYGDKQRRAPGSVDLTTVVRNLAPVLKHVAGGHVDVRLPARSSSLTVDIETEHVERLLVNLAAYGRERMPLGRLTIEVGTSIVDRHFTAKYPNVRPGPHALITVREARRPPRPEAFVRGAPNARDTVDHKRGIELGAIQGLVGDCGGHLWMKVEPLGDIVAKIRLPLLASDGQTHARALAAVGGRARALTRWFQH